MKCVVEHKNNKEKRMAENNTPYILYIKGNGTKRKNGYPRIQRRKEECNSTAFCAFNMKSKMIFHEVKDDFAYSRMWVCVRKKRV